MKLNMEKLVIKAQEGDKEAFTQAILLIKNVLYKISKMDLFHSFFRRHPFRMLQRIIPLKSF